MATKKVKAAKLQVKDLGDIDVTSFDSTMRETIAGLEDGEIALEGDFVSMPFEEGLALAVVEAYVKLTGSSHKALRFWQDGRAVDGWLPRSQIQPRAGEVLPLDATFKSGRFVAGWMQVRMPRWLAVQNDIIYSELRSVLSRQEIGERIEKMTPTKFNMTANEIRQRAAERGGPLDDVFRAVEDLEAERRAKEEQKAAADAAAERTRLRKLRERHAEVERGPSACADLPLGRPGTAGVMDESTLADLLCDDEETP